MQSETRSYYDMMRAIAIIEQRWEAIEPPCEEERKQIDPDLCYYYFDEQKEKEGVDAPSPN